MKYEILKRSVTIDKIKYHQIKALEDIRNAHGLIEKGELGGWVCKDSSISQEGTCWIDRNVYIHKSSVNHDAYLTGSIKAKYSNFYDSSYVRHVDSEIEQMTIDEGYFVGSSSVVCDIFVDALIDNCTFIEMSDVIFQLHKDYNTFYQLRDMQNIGRIYTTPVKILIGNDYDMYFSGYNSNNEPLISVGCQMHSIETWKKSFNVIARKNGFPKKLIPQYQKALEYFESIYS
jgi:hypothetical protein